MKENNLEFNLISTMRIGWQWRKYIIGFALVVGILTAVYCLILKNQYTSYANFYPANSVIGSRDNMFRPDHQDAIDMFGLENEVDRFYNIGNSSPMLTHLITKYKIAEHYKIDIKNNPKNIEKLYKIFDKNYQVSKGAYGNLELTMTDEDKDLAAQIANDALIKLQDDYRAFYVKSSVGLAEALGVRMKSIDSTIATLTDSLVGLRTKYNIYSVISPSRIGDQNYMNTNARGFEDVQTVEELKDRMVMDKAKYASIQNEFLTIQHKSIPFIHVVQYPEASGQKAGPFRTLMVLGALVGATLLGLLASVLLTHFTEWKNKIAA